MESDFEEDEKNYQDNDYNFKNINLISSFKINKRKNKNNIHLKNEIFNKEMINLILSIIIKMILRK